jgi:hypothetical protein
MFKIGTTPAVTAGPLEHADFLELECLRQSDGNASGGDLRAALSRVSDDIAQDKSKADDRLEAAADAAFDELARRSRHSGTGLYIYPFDVDERTKLLQFTGRRRKAAASLYIYLLFATRMNMRDNKMQASIDGTHLFEEVCCEVAKNYWGERTHGLVFGTARRRGGDEVGAFTAAVDDLCGRMGEGVRFFAHSNHQPQAQDGNLDVVVWKPFSDERHGKLVGFGQCKTGTHWKVGLFELVPEGFCAKWVRTQPVVKPLRLLFIASSIPAREWFDCSVDAGICFDRCRILDFAPKMPALMPRWMAWTNAAMTSQGLRPL